MIIVKLMGGLGNQMFQYAMARRIAYVHSVPLKLDISGLEIRKLRTYGLKNLNIIEDFASKKDIAIVKKRKVLVERLVSPLIDKFKPYFKRSHVKEQHILQKQHVHFDPNILKVSGNAYIEGYWQSEKYFKDIEDIIRREFTLRVELGVTSKAIAKRIKRLNAVSLHIRRKDYVYDQRTKEVFGLCPIEYYCAAVEGITQLTQFPHFFIFSDDPEWGRKNLKLPHSVTFVSKSEDGKDYEDLWLMSLCKHHIIANSSFSWWGAWLNPRKDKIVLAPRRWFNADEYSNTKDLVPDDWIRL